MNTITTIFATTFACVAALAAGFFAGNVALYFFIRKVCPAAILSIDRVTLGLDDKKECELIPEEFSDIVEDDPALKNEKLEAI